MIKLIKKHWLPITAAILTTITTASLLPLSELPPFPGSDKTHHLIAYAALAFPISLRKPKYLMFALLGFIAWSGAIELIQPYVNRYGEWLDLAANTCGLLIGWLLARLYVRWADNRARAQARV